MKTFEINISYYGVVEVDVDSSEELERKLWVVHKLFGDPFHDLLLEVQNVEIECLDEDEEEEE